MNHLHTQPSYTPVETNIPVISQPKLLIKAIFKTLLGLFNPKLWLLSLIPFVAAAGIWIAIGFFAWDSVTNALRDLISGLYAPDWFPAWLPDRMTWASLGALLLTLPLVSLTAFALVNCFGTQTIAKRLAKHYNITPVEYTKLERSTNTAGTIWHSVWVLTVLTVLWLISLPTWLMAGLGLVVQLLLLAWANSRLFSRDVLLDFADKPTRKALIETHRNTLWSLGLIASVASLLPSALWLGGILLIPLLQYIALVGVWMSIMVFLASGTLFSHYLMPALLHHQRETAAAKAKASKATIDGAIKEVEVFERLPSAAPIVTATAITTAAPVATATEPTPAPPQNPPSPAPCDYHETH
jgi:hypothetical protein